MKLPIFLQENPAFLAQNFDGYVHYQDPTTIPFNKLTYPSYNCSIPSFDRIVPDKGKTPLGQDFTENAGFIGNKQKFKNLGGFEMEARVFQSSDANLKDVISVGIDLYFMYVVSSTSFIIGETISGESSGATAQITDIYDNVFELDNIQGQFEIGETINGLSSMASTTSIVVPEYTFQQISENNNPLPVAPHEYYFDEWFDTNLNPEESKNLPRLIWVNGYRDNTNKGEIYSWTGGVAFISNVVGNDVSINPNKSWRSLGFSEDANGDAFIVVNGVSYSLDDPADLDTSTITLDDATGISIGDVATSLIEVDESPIPFDVCKNNQKGYMFYGNWENKSLYQTNAFNRPSVATISQSQAFQNDMVLSDNASYTGTGSHIYRITIDSITPAINQQSFVGVGVNDITFDTSAYNGTGKNEYKVVCVANHGFTFVGTPAIIPAPGDILTGGTSNAVAQVQFLDSGGEDPVLKLLTPQGFIPGEVISGSQGTPYGTVASVVTTNWFQFYKNGVPFTPTGYTPFFAYQIIANLIPLGVDGLSLNIENIATAHNVGDYWTLTIQKEEPDTFQWQVDNADPTATGVVITGGNQTLELGIRIKFVNTTGHKLGDYWDISVNQEVERAWTNFYYTLPRRIGEGYIYTLPSNFWTMGVQEEELYVNGSYGEWSLVLTQLSENLQSESISLNPLKQAGASKVLYPYLLSNISDKLVFISTDKELTTLGREDLLEKPQTRNISDPVKNDFQICNFKGGRINYNDEKIFISSPEQSLTLCYDTIRGYWQPPKTFIEVGLLSVVGNTLITHSNLRNRSFTMFTNTNGDNGSAYTVSIRTPYTPVGDRWSKKTSSMSFIEGYITGAPKLEFTAYQGVNGCGGINTHEVVPKVCTTQSNAPFGQGSFGSHPFGSDFNVVQNHFQEINKEQPITYYLIALGLVCTAQSHTWSILSMGMNAIESVQRNNKLVNKSKLITNNDV